MPLPRLPGVLLGRTKYLAWSLTDMWNRPTLLYRMLADPKKPDRSWWRGGWRGTQVTGAATPIAGQPAERFLVQVAADGPLLSLGGSTYAVW